MKKIFLLLIVIVLFGSNFVKAQTIDDFNYTGNLTSSGWTSHSGAGTNPISTTAGLSYTGYINSGIGNAALIGNAGGEDVNLTAGVGPYNTDGSSVYLSFMVNVTESGNKAGDYFFNLGNRVSATSFSYFAARVFAKVSAGVVNFGISNTSTASYGTTNFSTNTTYLIVVKYTINASGNDPVSIWVVSSGIPVSEAAAGTPECSSTSTAGQDIINGIALRQGSSSTSVQTVIDGIRLGTSWSEILPVVSAPVAKVATNITSTGFTANWNSFSGAITYFLDVSTASDFTTFLSGFNGKEVGNVTSYDISALDPNTTYYYRVRSSDGTATTSNSNIITVGTVVPAPNALAATNITSTGFTANWETSPGSTGYWLDITTVEDFSSFVAGYNNKEVGNVTTLDVSSLNAGQKYYYRVRGSSANGPSVNSNIITVETSGVALPVAQNPTNITTDGFTANWSFPDTPIGYFLDISTKEDFSVFVEGYNSKEVGTVTDYVVTGLNASTVYYYRVHATTSGGISPNSNVITVTTLLGAPVAKPATNIAATSFTANWEVTSGVTTYWLDVSTSSDFAILVSEYDNKPVGKVGSYEVTSLNPNTIYYYRVSSSNSFGTSPYSGTITVAPVVGIQDASSTLPTKYDLLQNYPNPFNPSTIIKYQLPESGFVTLKVYSITGSEICTLVSETKSAGTHEVRFNASNLTSGTYIYKIQSGNFSQTKKMLLVK